MKSQLIAIVAVVLVVGCGGPPKTISEAADEGNIEAVKQYLDGGVDVNVKDIRFGWTPLHRAATTEIAELLIAEGADVNAKDEWGDTPLHRAAQYGRKEVAELLIDNGADVNAKADGGMTALHSTLDGGHKEIVELLIANGADVNVKTKGGGAEGWTVLDWAELFRKITIPASIGGGPQSPQLKAARKEIVDLIRKHGGRTAEELALMPRLEYGEDQWPFGFSFTAKKGRTYVVEVTQDFKHWGELETIKGRGKQVEFIDPRQPLVQFKRNFYRVKVVD